MKINQDLDMFSIGIKSMSNEEIGNLAMGVCKEELNNGNFTSFRYFYLITQFVYNLHNDKLIKEKDIEEIFNYVETKFDDMILGMLSK